MSRKKTDANEDPFASIPMQETFDAFPALDAFPENAIAFLTGKAGDAPKPFSKPQNPSVKKSDTKPVNQPTKQSDTPTDNQPQKQTARQAVSQPDTTSDRQADSQPEQSDLTASDTATTSRSIAPSITPSTSQPVSPTNNLSPNQTVSQTQTLSEALSPSHLQSQTQSLASDLSPGRFTVADRLNHNQRRVLDFLLAVKPYIIKFRDIAAALAMREATIRTILRRLEALSFLSFQKARDGNIQGVRVAFNQALIEQYQQDRSLSLSESLSQSPSYGPSVQTMASLTPSRSSSLSSSQPDHASADPSPDPSASKKRDRKENLSIEGENPLGWDDAFLAVMWPSVHEAGFRLEQLIQACQARAKLGKEPDRDMMALSLDRADWELETKGQLVNLATGEKVRNAAAYIFTALARWGVLRAHPEYVSREEALAASAAAELTRRREAAEAVEAAKFERWQAELSEEELARAMAGFPGGPKDVWLRNFWRKNVRDRS